MIDFRRLLLAFQDGSSEQNAPPDARKDLIDLAEIATLRTRRG